LQLASYTDAQSAQRFAQALRKEGLNPKVVKNAAGGRSVWRVRLELAGTRREAESLAARLNMQFRIQSLLLARD
jgi:cell division protein FtsN